MSGPVPPFPAELEDYISYTTPNPTFTFVIILRNNQLEKESWPCVVSFIRNFQDNCLIMRNDEGSKIRLNCETIVYTEMTEEEARKEKLFNCTRLNNFFISYSVTDEQISSLGRGILKAILLDCVDLVDNQPENFPLLIKDLINKCADYTVDQLRLTSEKIGPFQIVPNMSKIDSDKIISVN